MSTTRAPGRRLLQYTLEIAALTPVHVGDGRGKLIRDVDFVEGQGDVWVIDPDKLWGTLDERRLANLSGDTFRLSRILRPQEYERVAAYRLAIQPGIVPAAGLLGFIKDVNGNRYLPGSSLKGAIRTLLLRAIAGPQLSADLLRRPLQGPGSAGSKKKKADDAIEVTHLGRNPNEDLLRTIHVFDSAPVAPEQLRLVGVAIYSLRGGDLVAKGSGYRFGVEAIPAGSQLKATLTIDAGLLEEPRLDFARHADRILNLASTLREGIKPLVERELDFYRRVGMPGPARFYRDLGERIGRAEADECFVQLGWGTGWLGKALGPLLQDANGFDEIRQAYRLGREGVEFPKTRRLTEEGDRPHLPVGWLSIRMSGEA